MRVLQLAQERGLRLLWLLWLAKHVLYRLMLHPMWSETIVHRLLGLLLLRLLCLTEDFTWQLFLPLLLFGIVLRRLLELLLLFLMRLLIYQI